MLTTASHLLSVSRRVAVVHQARLYATAAGRSTVTLKNTKVQCGSPDLPLLALPV